MSISMYLQFIHYWYHNNKVLFILLIPLHNHHITSFHHFYSSKKALMYRICQQCRRHGFDPWVGKNPWRRKWQPTPVFLPGKSHGQRSLVSTVHEIAKNQTWLSNWKTTKTNKKVYIYHLYYCSYVTAIIQ